MNRWVELQLRVRYAETDAMGVAHHAAYFVWFEAARAELCRTKGLDYIAMERDGLFLPVAEARCRYRVPLQYDDLIVVRVQVREIRRSVAFFTYEIHRSEELAATGETVQPLVGKDGKLKAFTPEQTARMLS